MDEIFKIKQYRKRPLVIHAAKWNGKTFDGLYPIAFFSVFANWHYGHAPGDGDLFEIVIETLEGEKTVDIGDWVIKGIRNEFYPCKPEIFAATYDEVEQTDPQDAA